MRSHPMRTTLAIDDDVMQAARVLARQQGNSLGAVISALARPLSAPPPQQPKPHPPARDRG